MRGESIYDESALELLEDDDEISIEEEGFMIGYLKAINKRFIKL